MVTTFSISLASTVGPINNPFTNYSHFICEYLISEACFILNDEGWNYYGGVFDVEIIYR